MNKKAILEVLQQIGDGERKSITVLVKDKKELDDTYLAFLRYTRIGLIPTMCITARTISIQGCSVHFKIATNKGVTHV